jgi:hypothetical protein
VAEIDQVLDRLAGAMGHVHHHRRQVPDHPVDHHESHLAGKSLDRAV